MIAAVGVLIAVSVSAVILITNRYQVSQPFTPRVFTRFDRWTGKVENVHRSMTTPHIVGMLSRRGSIPP